MRLIIFTIVVGTIFLSVSYFVLAAVFFYASGNEILIENVILQHRVRGLNGAYDERGRNSS
jgi:hypothetical protein